MESVKLGNNQSYIKDENANETTLDQNTKAPSNYHVSSLNEMKKIARDCQRFPQFSKTEKS